jgi:hypothetical protein
LEDIHDREAD